jgi:calcium-dependent protein kinase
MVIKQILQALAYCHERGLVHRDLKPQNVLIESKEGLWFVKLIDFGFAKFFPKDHNSKEKLGTPLFMAPEILKNEEYNNKVDIWSVGIMLFMMLTGKLPFPVQPPEKLYKSICEANPTHDSFMAYPYISTDAIDFLVHCLNRDPSQRSTSIQLLDHPWLVNNAPEIKISNEVSSNIVSNLKSFNAKCKLEEAVYTYLAMNAASIEDEKNLRDMFIHMDTSKDGKISKDEFVKGMKEFQKSVNYSDKELADIFNEVDADGSGTIDYTEFLRAAMNKTKLLSDKNLRAAFDFFDKDKSGTITKQELKAVFTKGNINLDEKMFESMMAEVDVNSDNTVYILHRYLTMSLRR